MTFDTHKRAVEFIGDPYIRLGAARNHADGETIPIGNTDWSAETLSGYIALGPDQPSLATFNVSQTTETKSWQDYKDECIPVNMFMECADGLEDTITTTLVSVSWNSTAFSNLPRASKLGAPVELYFEIRRTDGSGPRFVAGDFILTERIT